jgi:hypothetical protein
LTTPERGRRIVEAMISHRRTTLGVLTVMLLLGAPALDAAAQAVPIGRAAPEIAGGPWINSEPLPASALRGRVVFIEFWTYG